MAGGAEPGTYIYNLDRGRSIVVISRFNQDENRLGCGGVGRSP